MTKHQTLTGAIIALIFLIAFAALTKTRPESWNDISRIAGIESLVERGTWAIDDSPWVELTEDKIFLNGQFYSDKMPMLSFLGVAPYAVLRYALGASLAPDCRVCAYPWLSAILVALPAAVMLWLFYDLARRNNAPVGIALIGTLALGLGTMIFPYALVFNNHVPTAASVFASYYLLTRAPSSRGALLTAGLLATLAVAIDVLSAIIALSLVGIALARARAQFAYFVIGAAIPIVVTAILDYQIAQTLLPPYFLPEGYNYPGAAAAVTVGGLGTPDDYAAYAFRMFLGGKGLFAYNPLLLFAVAGATVVALNRKHTLWIEGIATAANFVVWSLFLATQTGNYGGTAYGERWFIVAIPILFSFIFFVPPLSAASWKNAAWLLFLPLLALSIFSGLQGAQAPWQDWLPPLQVTRSNQFPIFGFRWNVK
ncbi:MAG: hypothetical protein HY782_16260 [Chloroflexi bacterium]|nr:hypothetical protein [Chloroflexota bacterium]